MDPVFPTRPEDWPVLLRMSSMMSWAVPLPVFWKVWVVCPFCVFPVPPDEVVLLVELENRVVVGTWLVPELKKTGFCARVDDNKGIASSNFFIC